jgi:hypothetical protein
MAVVRLGTIAYANGVTKYIFLGPYLRLYDAPVTRQC